jgi:HPt (histidine-containing phosphotransfer) domain-containing protein
MNQQPITVVVAKDLEDLIPSFMSNRNKELSTLRTALGAGDMEQLRQLGHRMKGVGNSYGFEQISILGKRIEDEAKTQHLAGIEACISEYDSYLASVKIIYE